MGRVAALLSTILLSNFSPVLSTCLAVQSPPPELLVAAAADLAPLQEPLTRAFERSSGIRLRFVLGSSGMLSRQIEQGAPYDVFLSANENYVAELARAGRLAPDSVRTYASGRIALWSKDGRIQRLEDLRSPRVLHFAIPNPVHAPYGAAAKEALVNQGLWIELQSRLVFGENVRQAFQYARSGNAEAVITAWSLVFSQGGILLPENLHSPIRHSCGIVASTRQAAAARRFLDFLTGPEGQSILQAGGLFPPSAARAVPRQQM
ncbi:MAG: molybdate ABC transporter substrate-binding protein [Bryobacteraceae bacterium]